MKAARLNDQLCFALYAASNRLTAIYRPILKPLNLTYTQFVVMMALWEKDRVSLSDLAERTGLSKATMTPLAKTLEEKQLIALQRVPGNDRQKRVELTKSGRQLASKSIDAAESAFCATGLTAKEAHALIKLCQRVAA